MSRTPIEKIGEFGLIKRIRTLLEDSQRLPPGFLGIGDDSAILVPPSGYELLLTSDSMVEGRHFLLEEIGFKGLGKRAMVQNISDIGAMGGLPFGAIVSLCLTPKAILEDILELYEGFLVELSPFGTPILGGNITQAPLMEIHITLLGIVEGGMAIKRSGAKDGDVILVTGYPGSSYLGLYLLKKGVPGFERTKEAYLAPRHRAVEGRMLAEEGLPNSMIDISDGLLGDLFHICEESHLGATVDMDLLPRSQEMLHITSRFGLDLEEVILGPSDDYELLFTLPEEKASKAKEILSLRGIPVSEIGRIQKGPQVWLKRGESKVLAKPTGWDHFK